MSVKNIQAFEFENHRDKENTVLRFSLWFVFCSWVLEIEVNIYGQCVVKKAIDSHFCRNCMNIELILVLQLRLEFGRISQWKAPMLCLRFLSSAHFCCSCLNSETNCVAQETLLGYGVCLKYHAKYGKNTVSLSSMPCISFIDNLHVY